MRHIKQVMTLGALLIVWACSATQGMSFFGIWGCPSTLSGFADLLTTPSNRVHWDRQQITFKFASSFDAAFPDPRIKAQVRRAFADWNHAVTTPRSGAMSYQRRNDDPACGDIRSIALHEIGHVLGLHHPDQADDMGANFSLLSFPGLTLTRTPSAGNEVMNSFINPGWNNRILSFDELDGYRVLYGTRQIVFQEVGVNQSADMEVKAENLGESNVWARGGPGLPIVNPFDLCNGGVPWFAFWGPDIKFNTASSTPLGFKTRGVNWDFRVLTRSTDSIEVPTFGSDAPAVFHYDSTDFSFRFDAYNSAVDTTVKDKVTHNWTLPFDRSAGARRAIPAGELFHVGVELDVQDWRPGVAQARLTGFPNLPLTPVGFHEWNNVVAFGGRGGPHAQSSQQILEYRARGFVLQLPSPNVLVHSLKLADVSDMPLGLSDLNGKTMTALQQKGRLIEVADFKKQQLKEQEFFIVLQGKEGDLPDDIRTKGNFLILNRPDLLDKDLFVFVQSETPDAVIGNYALIGNRPIVGKAPEAPKLAKITGKVVLEGLDPNAKPQSVTLQLRRINYSGYEDHTINVGVDGTFSIPVPQEVYEVHTAATSYLSLNKVVDARNGDVTGLIMFLNAGDANGDNAVDVLDLDKLIGAFDSHPGGANWDENADFNHDDSVDVFDLDLLIRNFDAQGAP